MQTFFYDILHAVSQVLLVPDIILLLALIGFALFCIGSVIVEYVTEHKHFEVAMPKLLEALTESDESLIPSVIEESGLLRRQKDALNTVYEYRKLPGDALIALVKRLMNEEESHYDVIVSRCNMAAKVAPMLGLMGTLIPLGPGIEALGRADTAALSSSLLVAFDTTVAGLVTAAVCLVIGKIRSTWYDNYLSALDSALATMLQKFEDDRALAQAQAQAQPTFEYEPLAQQAGYSAAYGEQVAAGIPAGVALGVAEGMAAGAVAGAVGAPADMPAEDPAAFYEQPGVTGAIDPAVPATTPSGMPIDPAGAQQDAGGFFVNP